MVALKPVPGVVKFRFYHHVGSDTDISSHLYYRTGQAPTQAQAQSAADAAHTAYVTNCIGLLHNLSSLVSVTCTDLSDPAGPVGSNVTGAAGTRAQGEVPANAVALLNIHVARRYRGGKPRVYWPWGAAPDIQTPQTWSTTFVTACNTALAALDQAIHDNLVTWAPSAGICSVSYFTGRQWIPDHLGNYHRIPTPRDTPLIETVQGALAINTIIGSQRGRLRPN